jgi:hypothetical protein
MARSRGHIVARVIGLLSCGGAAAQPATEIAHTSPSSTYAAAPANVLPVLAAGTPVVLRLGETIGSNTHEHGAKFVLEVLEPVLVDGVTAIPAGSRAEGEVVHAAKSGSFGKPGELTLTSRAVVVGDRRIPLRGLMPAAVAHSRQTTAGAVRTTADVLSDLTILRTTASGIYGTAIAAFIQGQRIVVPAGTELVARVASDESLTDAPIVAEPAAATSLAQPGSIVFYRARRDGLVGLTVREGTTELGTLRSAEYLVVAAPPGVHEYTVRLETRDVLRIEVKSGEIYYVQGTLGQGIVAPRPNLWLSSGEAFEAIRDKLDEVAPQGTP